MRLLPDTPLASHVDSRVRSTAMLAVGMLVVFLVAADRLMSAQVGIGIGVLALALIGAARRTPLVVFLGFIVIALVPVYWGPVIPHTQIGILPVLPVCLALVPRAMRELPRFRLLATDYLMASYIGLRIVGSLLNSSRGAGSALTAVLYAGLPYAVFRLVGLERAVRRVGAFSIIVAGVVASFFAIREYGGAPNPFFNHFPHGHQHAYWVRVDKRFGRPRPEASFGHADALGLFLAFGIVLAFALAWRERSVARRLLLYAGAGICAEGIADTLERGPIIFLLIGIPIVLLVEIRQGEWKRLLGVALVVAAALSFTSIGPAAIRLRDASLATGGRENLSAQDRYDTLRAMTDPRFFSLLGHDQGDDPSIGVQAAIGIQTGLGAIENAFMFTYVAYGALAALAFAAIFVPIVRAAFTRRIDLLDRAWLAIVASCFVIFLSVSFAAQFGHFFWIALGIATAATQEAANTPISVEGDLKALTPAR